MVNSDLSAIRCLALLGAVLALAAPRAAGDAVHALEGQASWYGGKFQGRLTANGEVFDTTELTAAHKTLPFGTIVEVTNLSNGRTVQVRINDRGPFVEGRVIDLSRAAADALGMAGDGVAPVRVAIIAEPPEAIRSIQVGSFRDRENAQAVGRRLAESGIEIVIETGGAGDAGPGDAGPGDAVYRVIVPGVPESAVSEMLERLAGIGYTSVLVRSR